MLRLLMWVTCVAAMGAAGCGAPGIPGRRAGPADPAYPFNVGSEPAALTSECGKLGCTGKCDGKKCGVRGVTITTTGLPRSTDVPEKKK